MVVALKASVIKKTAISIFRREDCTTLNDAAALAAADVGIAGSVMPARIAPKGSVRQ